MFWDESGRLPEGIWNILYILILVFWDEPGRLPEGALFASSSSLLGSAVGFRVLPLSSLYCLDEPFCRLLGTSCLLQNGAEMVFYSLFIPLDRDFQQGFRCVLFAYGWRICGILCLFRAARMRLQNRFFAPFSWLCPCLNHLLFLGSIAPSHHPNKAADRIGNAAFERSVKWRFWGNKVRGVPYQYW